MAIKEQDKVFYEELANGDKVINLPVTRVNNVEGLGRSANTAYVVNDVVYVDNNKKVALKCITAGTTSNSELNVSGSSVGGTVTDGGVVWKVVARSNVLDEGGTVPIANGGTGGNTFVKSASISGKTITLNMSDGTNKTLTTQDTAPYSGSATSIGGASTTKPAVVVESYRNGYNWYRKYSDGWVEQGGAISITGTYQDKVITFSKAFKDTNYCAIVTTSENSSAYAPCVNEKTTTSFKAINVSMVGTSIYPTWYACGQGA